MSGDELGWLLAIGFALVFGVAAGAAPTTYRGRANPLNRGPDLIEPGERLRVR